MDAAPTLVYETDLPSARALEAALDRHGRRVTGFVPRGFDVDLRILNPIEHRDGSTSSWSAAWAENAIEPSPWMQWDELAALREPILPDGDGEPRMGDPHPSLARALIRAIALHHDLTGPHRFAAWYGYAETDREPAISLSSEGREMVLYSGPLLDARNAPLAPVTGAGRIPMHWWPDDLSWCLGQDIYARSLILGCDLPTGLAVLGEPALDAHRIREDDFVPVEDV